MNSNAAFKAKLLPCWLWVDIDGRGPCWRLTVAHAEDGMLNFPEDDFQDYEKNYLGVPCYRIERPKVRPSEEA